MAIETKTVSLPGTEIEVKRLVPQSEDVLTPKEADILHKVDRGELPCPCCGQPLEGGKVVIEGIYEGVLLSCSDVWDCGFVEG